MAARLSYDTQHEQGLFDRIKAEFPGPEPLPEPNDSGEPRPTPIFIVGLPRSGTTLLEQILSRHPEIEAAGELSDLPRQLRWTADLHGHAMVDDQLLAASRSLDYALLGERYIFQAGWRAQGNRYFVDKLPPNFMLIGHIRRAIPHARILHMVRSPMDVCFSNYRAMFGDSYAYSYDLKTLAHHHELYRELMAHWHRTMPGFVHDVNYTALVTDTDRTCRSLFSFLGLAFNRSYLTPSKERAVATLSSAQVREAVHARGIGAWREYATQLSSLHNLLNSCARR